MSPIHHHFELKGWAEVTIVVRFWLIGGLFVAAGVGVFYFEWVSADWRCPASRVERLDALTSWHADWRGLRVAVLGLGVTGFAVADTLAELGAEVLVVAPAVDDDRRASSRSSGPAAAASARRRCPASSSLRTRADRRLARLPPRPPACSVGGRAGVAVWGDIELAWRLRDKVNAAEWILVTGTNGKTTTTQLTATFLAATACGPRRAATSASRCSTRSAIPAASTCSSSSSRATSCTTCRSTGPGALHPSASVVPQHRRRPPRLARLVRGLPRGQGEGVRQHQGRLRLQPRRRRHARARRGRRGPGGLPRDRLRARHARAERPRRRRGLPRRPRLPRGARTAALELSTLDELSRAASRRRTASRTSSPPRRSHARPASTGRRDPRRAPRVPRRPPPHRAGRACRRHPLGRRLQGDERARGPRIALVRSEGRLDRRAACSRASTPTRSSRARESAPAAIVIGVDRSELVAAFRRHAPELPALRGRHGRD